MSRRRKVFLFLLFLLLGICAYAVFTYTSAMSYRSPKKTRFIVEKGQSAAKIAKNLEENSIISNNFVFLLYVRLTDQAQKLKPGEYEIPRNSSLKKVVAQIVSGRTIRYQITIPEGYTARQICEQFVKKELMTKKQCTDFVINPSLFLKNSDGIETLEGYLFPETYFFERSTTPKEMIQTLVNQFYKVIPPDALQKAKEKNLTLHEWVTLASLIEKETGFAEERPLIAGVFHNRLKKGMLLQTDPSVIYGIENFDGNLTRKHLQTDTPYNTYTRKGLPKGPIASPGKGALMAAIRPTATEAYYFVAKGGGKHYFSKTLGQHNLAVKYFILKTGNSPPPGEEEFLTKE